VSQGSTASAKGFDAAIIGGGPAGCSAAITLAGLGARVVLFETKSYPHDKLCGEFLSPECSSLLAGLGLTATLSALNPVMIETVCLSAPDGTAWEARLPGVAWGLTRKALDTALAQRASALGVDVRSATTVTGVAGNLEAGFTLDTRSALGRAHVRAQTVIAAHGKRSALDRALGRRFITQPQPFIALKAHFYGPPLPGRIELHTFPGGYCGMSEVEGGAANVCLLAHSAVFQGAGKVASERLRAFLEWMPAQNARLRDWLTQAKQVDPRWISIGQVSFADKRPLVNDVLMAGDAAGLIAPLAGDGIAMALHGGSLAADHCAGFLSGHFPARALRRRYVAHWQREFSAQLRLGRFLQAIMLRPAWLAHGLRLLNAVPPLGRYVLTHTRDLNLKALPISVGGSL
jgi:flavin-dependent dehydrogenase